MEKDQTPVRAEEGIRRTIRHLRRSLRVERAVLFGSHARGDADTWSDSDLAIVSPDFSGMEHRRLMDLLVEVALAIDPRVEIRPYTPKDLKEARPTSLLGQILKEGRLVYKNGRFQL